MSILTADAVEKIFMDCLYTEEESKGMTEPPDDSVIVDGILHKFALHPGRLESHREQVRELLKELPSTFQASGGGGWSFLQACMTIDGDHWGEHRNMEQLFVLGIGLKLAQWLSDRSLWRAMPGGMPYVVVL
jgi:hypothetical protein